MAKVGRPKKVVSDVAPPQVEIDGLNIMPTWNFQPETREQFIERVSVEIVTNLRDYDTLKNGRSMATAAFNIATELANLLKKVNAGD